MRKAIRKQRHSHDHFMHDALIAVITVLAMYGLANM